MAEINEYEDILRQMLDRVPDDLDKREGSVIYNTLAPTAYIIAQQDQLLAQMFGMLYADTAEGYWLDRVVGDFGFVREAATYSIREIDVTDNEGDPLELTIGESGLRFGIQDQVFTVREKLSDGVYKAVSTKAGTQGNCYSGTLVPLDHVENLGQATLAAQPLEPARDEETDDELRARFYRFVRQSPYGGNKADYEQKTLSIDGVGAVRVFGAESVGAGKVGLMIGDEQGAPATQQLINKVAEVFGSEGNGLAPIGHTVLVRTCTEKAVDVTAQIRVKSGSDAEEAKRLAKSAVEAFLNGHAFSDETVFHAKLVSEILTSSSSILDVPSATMNELSAATNLALDKTFDHFEVPVSGTITISEVS